MIIGVRCVSLEKMKAHWATILAMAMATVMASRVDAQAGPALTAKVSLAQHDYAKDADVEVTVALTNPTSHVVDVAARAIDSAVLLVDVRDAAGRHVATVPPPVPDGTMVHFAPGETRVVKVRLNVFSPALAAGNYVVGPAASVATGSAVSFHLSGR